MKALLWGALALLPLLPASPVAAAPEVPATSPEGGPITYTPPAGPTPPDVGALLLRLGLATALVLGLCVGSLWLARGRLARGPAARPGARLVVEETLALGDGVALHLLRAGGQQFVAGVSRTGLHALLPLPAPFQQTLDGLADLPDASAA